MLGDVHVEDLELGRVYFDVGYLDEGLRVPLVETVVYVGFNADIDGHMFRDAPTYFLESSASRTREGEGFTRAYPPDALDRIHTFEGLSRVLVAIGARSEG